MTKPLDKPTLREQLDAVRPDSEDLWDTDLQAAADAIEESDEWRDRFERQQAFDRDVSTAMQEVDVPDGFKSRLIESLVAAREQQEGDVTPAKDCAAVRRRSLIWAATACGLLLTATLGWLVWSPDGSQITLDEARQLLPLGADRRIDIAELETFDDSFAFDLPDAEWMRQTVMTEELKGLDWTGDARHDGAIYAFHVKGRIRGYLLVLPGTRLTEPLTATHLGLSVDYTPVINSAWVDPISNLAYICFVEEGDLGELQRVLYPHAA